MGRKKKEILIDTEEKKKEVYELFNSFKSKRDVHVHFEISDNKQGSDYIKEVANEIKFDLNIYKERKQKPKVYCLQCGKEIISYDKRKKFCNNSCAASFNNKGVRRNKKLKKQFQSKNTGSIPVPVSKNDLYTMS